MAPMPYVEARVRILVLKVVILWDGCRKYLRYVACRYDSVPHNQECEVFLSEFKRKVDLETCDVTIISHIWHSRLTVFVHCNQPSFIPVPT
jgi:hypothetical protein